MPFNITIQNHFSSLLWLLIFLMPLFFLLLGCLMLLVHTRKTICIINKIVKTRRPPSSTVYKCTAFHLHSIAGAVILRRECMCTCRSLIRGNLLQPSSEGREKQNKTSQPHVVIKGAAQGFGKKKKVTAVVVMNVQTMLFFFFFFLSLR